METPMTLDPQNVRLALEVGAGVIAVMSVGFVIAERLISRRGLELRTIQFLALLMFAPLIFVLSMERILDGAAAAALIGAIAGFLLADLRQPAPEPPPPPEPYYPPEQDHFSGH
jgi:hypothetical protein